MDTWPCGPEATEESRCQTRTDPAYTREFPARTVRLARPPGHSTESLAHDLGMARESVRRWSKQAEIDAGHADGLSNDEWAVFPDAPSSEAAEGVRSVTRCGATAPLPT